MDDTPSVCSLPGSLRPPVSRNMGRLEGVEAARTPRTDSTTEERRPERLALQCQAGCQESFAVLVELFQDRLFNFLWQLTRNHHDAQDLTQETFVKAYTGLVRYSPAYAFSTWLYTIARRCAASHFRRLRRCEELGPEAHAVAGNGDPAETAATQDDRASLWTTARQLKPREFEILWLRYGEGFPVADVARIMGIHQVHAKVLLHRARARLAGRLTQPIEREIV